MSSDVYRLTPDATARASAAGLVDAHWYRTPVSSDVMRRLTRRSDRRAAVDAVVWLALLAGTGTLAVLLFGSWWAIPAFAVYGTLYGGAADARWHEYGHGTAFKTRWPNQALYYLASFMLLREPTRTRWSHVRHHSDTIIVGRDPEIILRRPPDLATWLLNLLNLVNGPRSLGRIALHATGRSSEEEDSYLPAAHRRAVIVEARCYIALLAAVAATCVAVGSPLPALLVGLPSFYGAWLVHVLNVTQHAGLPENVLDHRQVARTMLLNPVGRFLYLNMNYHIEHHMYPAVPYHRLSALHDTIKHDLPPPNTSLLDAYREIVPMLLAQRRNPQAQILQAVPIRRTDDNGIRRVTSRRAEPSEANAAVTASNVVRVCDADEIEINDVARFDHDDRTFAVYRLGTHDWHATDGICTHGRTTHLATGTILGDRIECPKHNGQFHIPTGQAVQAPACSALATYRVDEKDGAIYLHLDAMNSPSSARTTASRRLAVVADGAAVFVTPGGDVRTL